MTVTLANHDVDLATPAALLGSRFRGRGDVYLNEQDGYIRTVHAPLTEAILRSHLKGECRVGRFPIENGMTSSLCWDVDCKDLSIVKALLGQCARWGLPVLLELSKSKGYHLWVLLIDPVSASMARNIGLRL